MREELVTLETANLAKEKGFSVPVYGKYNTNGEQMNDICRVNSNESRNNVSAPTQSLLQKWLREEKDIHIQMNLGVAAQHHYIIHNRRYALGTDIKSKLYDTYEEALEQALLDALNSID